MQFQIDFLHHPLVFYLVQISFLEIIHIYFLLLALTQQVMTNKADIEQVYFHNYQKHSRVSNPTYVSNFVSDSLSIFTPQKSQPTQVYDTQKGLNKGSEYKSNFQPLADKINLIGWSPNAHNYAKFSKQAFQRSKSYLSKYGTSLLSQNYSDGIQK